MQWTVAISVDTHKGLDVAVAFDVLGVELGSREIATTEPGYRDLLGWARGLGVPAFAVEGCGSYGGGLARFSSLLALPFGSASARVGGIAVAARAV